MVITTVAGTGTQGSVGDNGAATSAQFFNPNGVAADSSGNLFIADAGNHKVRKVANNGIITTFAGTGAPGCTGDDGLAISALLNVPQGVAVDVSGNLFIADSGNHKIRMVSSSGTITTFAGTGASGYSGDGGAATSATFGSISAIAVNSLGTVFIFDVMFLAFRKVISDGTITRIATSLTVSARGITADSNGNVYLTAQTDNKIRMISSAGIITTFAGTGAATLPSPNGVAVNSVGTLFIADSNNYVIRMDSDGIITTFAGTGVSGSTGDGGAPTSCKFISPTAVAVDSSNRVYVVDTNKVRMIGSIHACTAGNYVSSTSSGTCASCPTGSYSASTSAATSCNLCLANTYMTSTGATVCTACPTGSTTNSVVGGTSVASCLCLANTYMTSTGCTACPTGSTTNSVAGGTSVAGCLCSADTYMTSTGGTLACTACPTGSTTNSVAGSTSVVSCLCMANTYASSTGCTVCPAGFMNFVLGATSVASCSTVREVIGFCIFSDPFLFLK